MPNIYDKPVLLDFKSTYVSPNFAAIAQAAQAMDARGAQAEQMQWEMENDIYKVDALKQDKAERDQKIAEYDQELETALERAGGDYTKMMPFMKEQRRKLQRDLMMGEFSEIQKNYAIYQKWVEEHEDRVAKGDVNSKEFQIAAALAMNDYKGYQYGNLSLDALVNQNNYAEIAMDIASKMKASKQTTLGQWIQGDGGKTNALPVYSKERLNVTIEKLTPQEIERVVSEYISTNPVYQDHLDQRSRLEQGYADMMIEQNKTTFLEEYGSLSEEDKEIMRKNGKDPGNKEDADEYLKTLFREDIKNNIISHAVSPAANAFKVYNYEIDSDIFKDDYLRKQLENSLDLTQNAFVSSTPGTLKVEDYDVMIEALSETENSIETATQLFVDGLKDTGIADEASYKTLGQDSRATALQFYRDWTEKAPKGEDYTETQNNMIEAYMENNNVSRDYAKLKLEEIAGNAKQIEDYNIALDEQRSGLIMSQKDVIEENTDKLNESYKEYAERVVGKDQVPVSYEKVIEELSEITTEQDARNYARKLAGVYLAGPSDIRATKKAAYYGSGTTSTKEKADAIFEMWETINKEVRNKLEDGITQWYTQLDLAPGSAETEKVRTELVQAKEVFEDPGRRVNHAGVNKTLAEALGVNSTKGVKLETNLLFDFGEPKYVVRASIPIKNGKNTNWTDKVIVVSLPGNPRAEHTTRLMQSLATGQGIAAESAKMYLGAQVMGQFYNPSKYNSMRPGQSQTKSLKLANGDTLGRVKRLPNGDFVVLKVKNNPADRDEMHPDYGRYADIGALAIDIYEKKKVMDALYAEEEENRMKQETLPGYR